jgi:hypothetical protein
MTSSKAVSACCHSLHIPPSTASLPPATKNIEQIPGFNRSDLTGRGRREKHCFLFARTFRREGQQVVRLRFFRIVALAEILPTCVVRLVDDDGLKPQGFQKLRIRPSDGRSQRRDDPEATRAFLDSLWANRPILTSFSSIQFLARPNRRRHVEEFHQLNLVTARRAFLAASTRTGFSPRSAISPPPGLADN